MVKNDFIDGANAFERRTYDLLIFCETVFGGPTGGPFGGLRFQVSALRSQVSGVRPQKLMLSLTRFARFLTDAIAYQIFTFLLLLLSLTRFIVLTDAIAYQIFTFLTDAIAYQIFFVSIDAIA